VSKEVMPTFLYGVRGEAYTLYNLIPTITATLGIGSIPFLTTVWVENNKPEVKKTMETIIRTTSIIAIPAGIGLCAIAPNVMGLLYKGVAPVEIGAPILRMLGIAAVFSGLSVPMTNMLQAIGKPMLPLRNIAIGAAIKVILNFFLVGIPELNIWGAPIGTTACYVFIFISNMYCLIKHTGVKFNFFAVIVKPFISALCCGVCAFAVSTLITKLGKGDFLATLCGVAVAVIVYLVAIFALKTLSREDIEGFPKGKMIARFLEKLHIIK
jgi:stage V sporulation protein B